MRVNNKFSEDALIQTAVSLVIRKSITSAVELMQNRDYNFGIHRPVVYLGETFNGDIALTMEYNKNKLRICLHTPRLDGNDIKFSIGVSNGELNAPYLIESCKRVTANKIDNTEMNYIYNALKNDKIRMIDPETGEVIILHMYDIKKNLNEMTGKDLFYVSDPFKKLGTN